MSVYCVSSAYIDISVECVYKCLGSYNYNCYDLNSNVNTVYYLYKTEYSKKKLQASVHYLFIRSCHKVPNTLWVIYGYHRY